MAETCKGKLLYSTITLVKTWWTLLLSHVLRSVTVQDARLFTGHRQVIWLPSEYSTFYSVISFYYKAKFDNYETEDRSYTLLKQQSLYPIWEHILLSSALHTSSCMVIINSEIFHLSRTVSVKIISAIP
jgi:hypothetical protein